MVICIFGDSTAWGAWDTELGGWANRLWLFLARHDKDIDLYNLSISGGTSATILERFEKEAVARDADVVIFQTGTNDAAFEFKPDNHLVPPEQFRANIGELIARAKKLGAKVFVFGGDNVIESKTTPVPWHEGLHYLNADIAEYNRLMAEECAKAGAPFLDWFGILEDNDLDEDGLHPGSSGHEKIFEKVKEFLLNNGIINQ